MCFKQYFHSTNLKGETLNLTLGLKPYAALRKYQLPWIIQLFNSYPQDKSTGPQYNVLKLLNFFRDGCA